MQIVGRNNKMWVNQQHFVPAGVMNVIYVLLSFILIYFNIKQARDGVKYATFLVIIITWLLFFLFFLFYLVPLAKYTFHVNDIRVNDALLAHS